MYTTCTSGGELSNDIVPLWGLTDADDGIELAIRTLGGRLSKCSWHCRDGFSRNPGTVWVDGDCQDCEVCGLGVSV